MTQLPTGRLRSWLILGLFTAAFMLLVVLVPYGKENPILAIGLFIGVLGLFRLMSQFEQPR